MGFFNLFRNVEQPTPPLNLTRIPAEKKDGHWSKELETRAETIPSYENDPEMIKKIREQFSNKDKAN